MAPSFPFSAGTEHAVYPDTQRTLLMPGPLGELVAGTFRSTTSFLVFLMFDSTPLGRSAARETAVPKT